MPNDRIRPARLLMGAVAMLPATAHAQTSESTAAVPGAGIQDIVVTAQRRGENLQKVPIAIATLSGEAMQAKGINTVQGLVQATPTLYQAAYSTTSTTLFFFMRGMGLGDPIQITKDGAIGVYENGVYNARPQTVIFDLADVERVEVLRGPQGTLYGRNTTGGAINIISRAPSGEFGVRQLASYASRNQYRSITNVDLPEFANIAIKGTLAVGGDDGFGKNQHDPSVPDTNNYNTERHVGGRIAARWRPDSDFTADYSFEVARITATPMLLESPALDGLEIYPGLIYEARRDHAYRPATLHKSHVNIRDHAMTLDWKAMPNLTLRSITGIRYFHSYSYQDTLEVYLTPLNSTNDILSKQFSQELQAVGSAWDDRIKYTFGLYYYREKARHDQEFNLALGNIVSDYAIRARSISKAAYAQLTFTPPILGDRLDLTAGARVTGDKRSASRDQYFNGLIVEIGTRNDQKFTRFNPSFTASYRWSDKVNSYAKVSTGYRAGGSSETTPDFTKTYGPETLTSFEIGLKTELFDRRLRANFAAFYNKYKDIQLDLTLDPTNPTITATLNAGRATLKGLEAELSAAPTRDLRLDASYAFLDTKVNRVTAPDGSNVAPLFRIPYAPKHSINLSADYTVVRSDFGNLSVRADYSYKAKVWNTAGAGPAVAGNLFYRTKGFSNLDGRITLHRDLFGKPADLSLFSKNVLNSRHVVYSTAPGSQISGFLSPAYAYAAPRTIGVELSFAF